MNINIKTTTLSLTPAISDYVDKKLSGIKQFLDNDSTAQFDLELAKTTNHHRNGDIFKAEAHIVAKDIDIYTSVEREDLYAAIDGLKDEVMQKLKSTKDKRKSLVRRGGAQVKDIIRGLWRNKRV